MTNIAKHLKLSLQFSHDPNAPPLCPSHLIPFPKNLKPLIPMKIHHQDSIFKSPNPSSSSPSPSLPFKSQKTHDDSPLPLRIADILSFNGDVLEELLGMEEEVGCRVWRRSTHCYPSSRIVARWFSGLRRKRGKESRRDNFGDDRNVQVKCSTNGLKSQDSSNSASQVANSGQCNREATVNLGFGCCLLYLIAASKNELDKMIEMQKQMEKLLGNVREELQKKDELSVPCETNDVCAFSTTDVADGLDFENQLSPQILTPSYVLPGSSTITVCDQSLRSETPKQGEYSDGRDKLEAELEIELERLQLNLDTLENSVKRPQKKGRPVSNESTATSKSQTVSSREVVAFIFENQAAGSEEHCGVPPHELERRLHELLESRQQEEIRKLEATLECVKHKLREKEMEVSWWKDTARLISRCLPESSKLSSLHRAKLLSP